MYGSFWTWNALFHGGTLNGLCGTSLYASYEFLSTAVSLRGRAIGLCASWHELTGPCMGYLPLEPHVTISMQSISCMDLYYVRTPVPGRFPILLVTMYR